ncbi:MAG: hypothetical protein K2L17_05670 [Muribaculaceae bacterium]|nr:hypothetical protein [Muribaculaceae bacterium]
MEKLAQFIKNLSHRFRSENDLSDVTWTMCETSDKFQGAFLRFFFPWLKRQCTDVYMEREYVKGNCRPDFFFECDEESYIIENKIEDRNHHFDQYVKTFKIDSSHLGYIANYKIVKSGFNTYTWKELYQYLQQNIPEDERTLWEAYLDYIKNVCNIYIPTKPMDLNGMNSLYTFYRCLDDVFAFDNEYFHSELYPYKRDTKGGGNIHGTPREGIMGKYFELVFKGLKIKKAWGWMGVYFSLEEPIILIGFRNEDGWGQPIYRLLECQTIKSGRLFDAPEEVDNAYLFMFKTPANFNELSLPKQERLLRKFFEDVMMAIYNAKVLC